MFGLVENLEAGSKPRVPKLALTLRETAQALGLSPITIRRLNRRGLLRNVKCVRHLRFPVKEVERFLAETSKEVA
jgi:excisionase family DNA binding protein